MPRVSRWNVSTSSMSLEPLRGHCLCGSLRISLQWPALNPPSLVYVCHCIDCQRLAGPCQVLGIFNTLEVFIHDPYSVARSYTVPGDKTSSGQEKIIKTCGKCGCAITLVMMAWGGERTAVRMGLFEGWLEEWQPTQEWFVKRRPKWMKAIEGIMQFEEIGNTRDLSGPNDRHEFTINS